MKSVLVAGSNGGIGSAICFLLKTKGYRVIGIDRTADANQLDSFIKVDMRDLVISSEKRDEFAGEIEDVILEGRLIALVNNAAIQILSGMENIQIEDFKESMDVNVIAPLILSKISYGYLRRNAGSIVNVGSIHSKLTKPGFISYATSKAALLGLTQALAVDIGKYVRVNMVQPAAIETDMLLDGFNSPLEALGVLKKFHPSNIIGAPQEVAEVVLFLISESCPFINGSVLDINGGIGVRLHDPL